MMSKPYEELHVWQLSRSTTCYSGLKSQQSRTFATATHVISIGDDHHQPQQQNPIGRRTKPKISGHRLPTMGGYTSCAGYSSSAHQEVFVMLKESAAVKSTTSKGTQQGSSKTTSTTSSSSLRPSSNSTSSHGGGTTEQQQHLQSNIGSSIGISGDNIHGASTAASPATQHDDSSTKAWLVWKTSSNGKILQLPLQFRPLCPLLLSHDLVWVGSADDAKLRCYNIVEENETMMIQAVPLIKDMDPDGAFEFSSPVMTLAALDVTETKCWLSVGCQDGTIRVVEVENGHQPISNHSWMVDGPIISMVFSSTGDGDIQHYVGSMCGYVCKLVYNQAQGSWQGPSLVLDDLWDARLKTDDAVLAVCPLMEGTLLAVGTFSGKVYLVDETAVKKCICWECQLPYTIHAITPDAADGGNDFFVLTRRSLHWFGPNKNKEGLPKRTHDANLALERIKKLAIERGIAIGKHDEEKNASL